jgi:uncharacterized protein (DUF433 family)
MRQEFGELGRKANFASHSRRSAGSCHNGGRGPTNVVESLLARINVTPGLRSGQPCIRNLRITVWDILKWLGTGASHSQIISDYPELTEEDILAALQWASNLKDNAVIR